MKRYLLLVLVSILLSSCALSELASAPTNVLSAPTPAIVTTVAGTPSATITLAPTRAATPASTTVSTTPSGSLNGAADVDIAKAFDGAEAYEIVRYFTSKDLAGRKAGAAGADLA